MAIVFNQGIITSCRNSLTVITVSNEPFLPRVLSTQTGMHHAAFCDAVRQRDGGYIMTGDPEYDQWLGITLIAALTLCIHPASGFYSVQNGILLKGDIHTLFDSYSVAIDPDDDHKIIPFIRCRPLLPRLSRRKLESEQRPSYHLLKWRYRQAVLANMRGDGEPIFEHDFPPGTDTVEEILSSAKAAMNGV